jgi:hypothetical protein
MSGESWVLWELMGSTDGRTRGRMTKLLAELPSRGWELALKLSTVGSDGEWPHAMGLWRVPSQQALAGWLEAGWDDGVDEDAFVWGKSKLYRQLHGELHAGHSAFLVEYLVADSALALEGLRGPDAVFAEQLAPFQGLAIWSAPDLFALTEREWSGIGSQQASGIRQATGWWAVVTPERDIV